MLITTPLYLYLCLWAIGTFVLYKVVLYISSEVRHRNNARRLGCKPPHVPKEFDPFGLVNVRRAWKADSEFRFAPAVQEWRDNICQREGRQINTMYQNFLGTPMIFTAEPENIKTVLAAKFKGL